MPHELRDAELTELIRVLSDNGTGSQAAVYFTMRKLLLAQMRAEKARRASDKANGR